MYVYQTIYRSSVGCMCTWWIPEVGYPSYMYTMYRYINMDLLVKDRMVAEYLDSCIHCTFSKKKKKSFRTKDSYSVLLFSFLLVIVIVKSIKSNRKKKKKNAERKHVRSVRTKMLVWLPTHLAMQILSNFVWLEKQNK